MAANPTYLDFATTQDASLRGAMDHVITASLTFAVPILHWLAIAYIVLTFSLVAGNVMTVHTMIGRLLRLLFVVYFITGSGGYTTHVRDLAFDGVPQAIASVLTDTPTLTSAAQQFDIVSKAADNIVADAMAKNSLFSANGIGNSVAAWAADGGIQGINAVMFGVWLLGRVLLAIVLCFGPWLLVFELFDRTRGFVDQWIGKIVGLSVFGLASAVLLQIVLRGELDMLTQVHNSGGNIDQIIAQLVHVVALLATDALAMLALPAICAIGSAAAAGHAVASGAFAGAFGRAASTAAANGSRGAQALAASVRQGVRQGIKSARSA